MRIRIVAALVVAALSPAVIAPALATPAEQAVPAYDVEITTIGELLDDPAAKAVLEKHIKPIVENPQIDNARGLTLKNVQEYASDIITEEKLAAIQADLRNLPLKK